MGYHRPDATCEEWPVREALGMVTTGALDSGAVPVDSPRDGRRARGIRSRKATLERSVQLCSQFGLEGLTIGALASDLGVSKSTVHALFGSKQDLQLATIALARRMLIDLVIVPSLSHDEGIARLGAVGQAWCDYLEGDTFAGGCFLCAASAEMDGRPGPVRDSIASTMNDWILFLQTNVVTAKRAGQLRDDVDPHDMAFRLNALGMAANWQRQLLGDRSGIEAARTGWRAELARGSKERTG
jgi:AcrR family transcriptional regulator